MKPLLIAVMTFALTCGCMSAVAQDATPNATAQTRGLGPAGVQRLIKEVRHELLLLPYYGVFDNLAYKVDPDGTVTLLGQVTKPTLKSDAESAVKHIEGVEQIVNQIEVLPLSPADDRIRRAIYRSIFGNEALTQYAVQAVPPIHIIVKNGQVTLVGAVGSQLDKTLAGTQANSVSGVFSVTNDLIIDNGK
jgi:hyperosmotically inducible protein